MSDYNDQPVAEAGPREDNQEIDDTGPVQETPNKTKEEIEARVAREQSDRVRSYEMQITMWKSRFRNLEYKNKIAKDEIKGLNEYITKEKDTKEERISEI